MTGATKTVLVIASLPFLVPVLIFGVSKAAESMDQARERQIKSLSTDKLLSFYNDPQTNPAEKWIAEVELKKRGIKV